MTTLADTRSRLTAIDSRLVGVTMHEQMPTVVRPGDGWTELRRVEPATFGACQVTWDVLIVLSQDALSAAQMLDDITVDVIDAVSLCGFTPVAATPQALTLDGAAMYALAVEVLTSTD